LTIPEDKAQAIAAAHMAGVPVTRICKELGVGYHTVAALIRNRPELLASARDITANNWRTLAALGTAELVDRLPEMKDQALSVLSAIATEKAELLSGGATSRVEVIAAPAVDEWSDVVDGVVIESVAVSMGNASRTAAPKAPPAPAPALADRADGEQPRVSECSVSVDSSGVSVFEPIDAGFLPPPPPTGTGGAGVRPSLRPSYPDSLDDSKIFSKSP
jgi:transposase-like protein